jgi:glyoxylase-like metal-dependent hydrolase (beta-lactamase superfamily II)
MPVHIDTVALGPLDTNCHVVHSGDDCWVVDPSMWPEPLLGLLR